MLTFLAVGLFSSLCAGDDEHTLVLTADNFKSQLKESNTLVEFYAPWCGHCKKLAPLYEAAAEIVHNDASLNTKIAKVDATVEEDLAKQYDVSGYPTIKFFNKGSSTATDYDGERTTEGIVDWIKTATLPLVAKVSGKKAKEYNTDEGYTLLAYLKAGSKKEAKFEKTCKKVKKAFKEINLTLSCAQVTLKKGKGRFVLRRAALSDVFPTNLEMDVDFDKDGKMSKLPEWAVENARHPQWGYVSEPMQHTWKQKENFFVMPGDKETGDMPQLMDTMEKIVALGIKPQLLTNEEQLEQMFGIKTKNLPLVMFTTMKPTKKKPAKDKMYSFKDHKKYILDPDKDSDYLGFIEKARAGDWKLYVKSQKASEVEEEQKETAVQILTGKTFEDNVYNADTDTFVEFYAPWCGHCKKFTPVYEKFAKYMKRKYPDLKVAKVDAINNEIDAPVESYPTLLLYPGGQSSKDKRHVKFNGDRDNRAEMVEFIEDNAEHLEVDLKSEL